MSRPARRENFQQGKAYVQGMLITWRSTTLEFCNGMLQKLLWVMLNM